LINLFIHIHVVTNVLIHGLPKLQQNNLINSCRFLYFQLSSSNFNLKALGNDTTLGYHGSGTMYVFRPTNPTWTQLTTSQPSHNQYIYIHIWEFFCGYTVFFNPDIIFFLQTSRSKHSLSLKHAKKKP
jgi:hypothetical protein